MQESRAKKRAEKAVRRWLARSGGELPPLGEAARDLLAARLAAQRRAKLICSPLVVLAVLLLLSALAGVLQDDTGDWAERYSATFLVSIGLVLLAALAVAGLARRADLAIGRALPRRVTRGNRVALRVMLGRRGVALVAAAVGLQVFTGLLPLLKRDDVGTWVPGLYWGGLLLTDALVAAGVRAAVRRATVAVDPVSLAIDERMRAEEALSAVGSLSLLVLAFTPSLPLAGLPAWLKVPWLVVFLVAQSLWLLLGLRPRWPGASTAAAFPDPSSRAALPPAPSGAPQ